jgi:hypothetical protein
MGAFDKLKQIEPSTAPMQKVVPVKENKRDSESSYTMWLDKELLKKLKLKAVEEDDNVKNIIERAIRQYLQ